MHDAWESTEVFGEGNIVHDMFVNEEREPGLKSSAEYLCRFISGPHPMRLALFDFRQAVDYRLEILGGLTVAMALIPEAVAFALIAGLSP